MGMGSIMGIRSHHTMSPNTKKVFIVPNYGKEKDTGEKAKKV